MLFAKLPPFDLLLAGALRLWDGGMTTLRALSAGLGVLSIGLIYVVVRWTNQDRAAGLALLVALMLAVYPSVVLYSRFGFSYNLLVPLALLAYLGLSRYFDGGRRRWLALAALSIGLGGASDLSMFGFLPVMALVALSRRWRDVGWGLLLVALPWGVYSAVMLASVPGAFVFDLRYTLSRLGGLSLMDQIALLARNYTILLTQDAWLALALVALGMAALLRYGLPRMAQGIYTMLVALLPGLGQSAGRWMPVSAAMLCGAIAIVPLITSTLLTIDRAEGHFGTVIDPFLLDPDDARLAAGWANQRLQPADVVIASPGLAWLLRANVADFQMVVAASGEPTSHLPANIPSQRFVFDPRLDSARYVIVDNLWRNWAMPNMPAAAALLRRVEAWPLVFKQGQIEIYQNPAR